MPEPEVVPDDARHARIGFDESIYCAGKSGRQLDAILARSIEADRPLLLTRLGPEMLDALAPAHRAALDYDQVSRAPRCWAQRRRARTRAGRGGDRGHLGRAGREGGGAHAGVLRRGGAGNLRRRRRGPVAPARSTRGDPRDAGRDRGRGHGGFAAERRREARFRGSSSRCPRRTDTECPRAAGSRSTRHCRAARPGWPWSTSTTATVRPASRCGRCALAG